MTILEQAKFIAAKLLEQVDDLPDNQPFNLECSEVRAIATTLECLVSAIEQFSAIGLETVDVCMVATEALQKPDPSIVRKVMIVSSAKHSQIGSIFETLTTELHATNSTKQ